MNRKTTLVLLLLLAAALGGLGLFRSLRTAPQPTVRRIFTDFEPDDVASYELKLTSGEHVDLIRQTTRWFHVKWRPDQPELVDRASEERLQHITDLLKASMREDVAANPSDAELGEFGLAPAHALLIGVTASGKSTRLLLGADDPDSNSCFGRIDGESAVFRTGRNLKNLLEFGAKDFRFEHLFTLDPSGVDSLEIQYRTGERAGVTLRADRGVLGWKLTSPMPARADDSRLSGAIAGLCSARLVNFLDDANAESVKAIGLAEPQTIVTITSGRLVETVEFGANDDHLFWAHRAGPSEQNLTAGKGAYLSVAADALKALLEPIDHFRSRRLIRAVADLATGLQATLAGQVTFRVERSGPTRSWRLTQPFAFNADERTRDGGVLNFLSRLDRTAIKSFVSPPANLPPPVGSLLVQWREKEIPTEAVLTAYQVEAETLVKRDDEPRDLYAVDPAFLDLIQCEPLQLRSKRLFDESKMLVASMDRLALRVGSESMIIERSAGSPWKAVGSSKSFLKMQGVAGGLALREAKRFLPSSERPALGEANAELEVSLGSEKVAIRVYGEVADGFLATCSSLADGTIFVMDRGFYDDLKSAVQGG